MTPAEILTDLTALIMGIAGATWEIFAEAAPYLFLGFGIAGLLHALVPDEKIVSYLGASAGKVRSVINAAIAGVPLPLCSCGGACSIPAPQGQSLSQRIYGSLKSAYVELLGDISKCLMVGIVIAGIISYAIPESFILSYLGGGVGSMLVMLVIGIPLYICATASTPLAAALIAKGMSPGTAFVFLLAGPATNAATITMVTKFLGKRSAAIYLASIGIFSIAFGLLLDFIYAKMGIEATSIVGYASEILPDDVKTLFAILMLPLIANGIYHEIRG